MYTDIENQLGVKIESKKFFKAGWAGETVSLKFENSDQKYVVKAYNKDSVQNLEREWVGLNFLYQAKFPVPKPVLSNFAHEKAYILMEQIDGEDLWTVYQRSAAADQQELMTKFMRAFFDLHSLDISTLNQLLQIESTLQFIEKEISDIQNLAVQNDLQSFIPVISWLHREKEHIRPEKLSILHRDYHPWNALADDQNNVYVIDLVWCIGDYRFDLAWFCALMERGGLQDFSNAAFACYQEFHQREIYNYDYFKVLATLRWLMNVISTVKNPEIQKPGFDDFIHPLIQAGIQTIRELTRVEITFEHQ